MSNNGDPNKVVVQPIRTYGGEDGFKHSNSAPYEVTRVRAAELKANGLVRDVDTGDEGASGKTASFPSNKKAPDPQNKARVR
ncbi:hypothetical protein [Caballeronia sp. ATUFL_F1_KS4A]|uniref:hypothetical protein n=1 Tax=Caballeronia sp. ATUFL_F1_KS4A TaxID=2921768 RepID=UPI0020282A23|nr:hypothetical protein [Caballeronia sp. ATUFL_F1_KS4A]